MASGAGRERRDAVAKEPAAVSRRIHPFAVADQKLAARLDDLLDPEAD